MGGIVGNVPEMGQRGESKRGSGGEVVFKKSSRDKSGKEGIDDRKKRGGRREEARTGGVRKGN